MGERVRQTDLQNGAKKSPNWVIWAHSEVVHVKQKSYEGKIVLCHIMGSKIASRSLKLITNQNLLILVVSHSVLYKPRYIACIELKIQFI
jgi:hypothetical protein